MLTATKEEAEALRRRLGNLDTLHMLLTDFDAAVTFLSTWRGWGVRTWRDPHAPYSVASDDDGIRWGHAPRSRTNLLPWARVRELMMCVPDDLVTELADAGEHLRDAWAERDARQRPVAEKIYTYLSDPELWLERLANWYGHLPAEVRCGNGG